MDGSLPEREEELRGALRGELLRVDRPVLEAIGRGLEREGDRLAGGSWGVDDGDGCLLTLAARELGCAHGEELLRSSIAAVRIPALFDELWAVILQRTGDATAARAITHRLVSEALALRADQDDGSAAAAAAPDETARMALPK